MATLYVEDVPDDVYQALRKRARSQGRSIAAEVRALLIENIPTDAELRRRKQVMRKLSQLRFTKGSSQTSLPSSLEMIREDRDR
jgi:plasmid stability protein